MRVQIFLLIPGKFLPIVFLLIWSILITIQSTKPINTIPFIFGRIVFPRMVFYRLFIWGMSVTVRGLKFINTIFLVLERIVLTFCLWAGV